MNYMSASAYLTPVKERSSVDYRSVWQEGWEARCYTNSCSIATCERERERERATEKERRKKRGGRWLAG